MNNMKSFSVVLPSFICLRMISVSIKLEAILSFIHYEERREEVILQSGPEKYRTVLIHLSLGL